MYPYIFFKYMLFLSIQNKYFSKIVFGMFLQINNGLDISLLSKLIA